VIKAAASRWTFEGGICDTAWEALVVLHHKEDDQMELDPVLQDLQLDMCFVLLSHSFSRDLNQLDKDSLPCSVKWFNAPTISRPLLLEIRMFRGPKLLKTHCRLNRSAMLVERKIILLTDILIHARTLISHMHRHLPLLMEPTPYMLLPGRTMPEGESTMLPWRKHRKLQMLSLVCFSSTPLLQLCYFILEHHILSYLLHMFRSIIYP
jgi:hypothetical protein